MRQTHSPRTTAMTTGHTRTYTALTSGSRASAYLAAGGFPTLRTAEDHALLRALSAAGVAAKRANDITVRTSARRAAPERRTDSATCSAPSPIPLTGSDATTPEVTQSRPEIIRS